MIRIIIALAVVGTLLACSDNNSKNTHVENPDIIEEELLVDILVDIHKLDAAFVSGAIPDSAIYNNVNLYYSVFENHGATKEEYNATIRHYAENDLVKMNELYDKVLAKLMKEKGELTRKLK